MDAMDENSSSGPERKWFSTTHWSVVLAAGSKDDSESQDALSTLCKIYWSPVYAFIRRHGNDSESAMDLTQGFFAALLERRGLGEARQDRGKFRSFLLTSVKNFLADERDRAQALKRGGGMTTIPIDADTWDSVISTPEPATNQTPESLFDRQWALTLLDQAMRALGKEMEQSGGGERFRSFRDFLVSDAEPPYSDLARRLGMAEGAARVALHRLRQRFGAVLRDQVAQTLEDPGKTEEELRYLINVMGAET